MYIQGKRAGARYEPLEEIRVCDIGAGTLSVCDGQHREYFRAVSQPEMRFVVGGTPGFHNIILEDETGKVRESCHFFLDARTSIIDQDGFYQTLLQMLLYTMYHPGTFHSETTDIRYQQRIYHITNCWLRFHVYLLEGLKYFGHDLRDGIDLYRDSQRDDGMIWNNVYPREVEDSYWDLAFSYDRFILPAENKTLEFRRIPVENDAEYVFVEGLYYTWKALGDDIWMASSLDAALKALEYSITSPYRWSKKYQLLKRGYTIDTWDFLAAGEYQHRILDEAMHADPERTRFGIMFGDNTGYAAACRYLAEMLEHVGRQTEAESLRLRSAEIVQRLQQLSWNGRFYTHHVAEDPHIFRDFGVNEADQISLSNAFSLNRGLDHEQCVQIIRTYYDLRQNLSSDNPNEWYTIYPPFLRNFNNPWHFVNGGVTPLVAGELARGAFAHGFEDYAGDILQRLYHLGMKHNGSFYGVYAGKVSQPPNRSFTPLDLSAYANIDVSGEGRAGMPGWTGEGENDLHTLPNGYQIMAEIPFLIPDPEINNGRGCIGLSVRDHYARRVVIPIGTHATCLYFLHTSSGSVSGIVGTITLHYVDGSVFSQYVIRGKNIEGWWFPHAPDAGSPQRVTEVGWRGKNNICPNIGVIAYGLNNPYPELQIERITLSAAEDGALWMIMGITLSDQPAYFDPGDRSDGIPDECAVATVIAALVEGLAGVVDRETVYRHVELSPRWVAADVKTVNTVIRYADSQGYVAYHYRHDPDQATIELLLTGSGDVCDCHVLLPREVHEVLTVVCNGEALVFHTTRMEESLYVDCTVLLPGPVSLVITYRL